MMKPAMGLKRQNSNEDMDLSEKENNITVTLPIGFNIKMFLKLPYK